MVGVPARRELVGRPMGVMLTPRRAPGRLDRAGAFGLPTRDVVDFLLLIDAMFSFCAGRWTGPILITGHDPTGTTVWENGRLTWISPFEHDRGWFPSYHTESALETFLPAFATICQDSFARRVLRTCIH